MFLLKFYFMNRLIQVLHPCQSEVKIYTPDEFEQAMRLKFLPNLTFPNSKVFEKVVKLCEKAHRKGEVEIRQGWLGALFTQEIARGFHPKLTIQWIDERIGYGVFAAADLPAFAYVGEYTGLLRKRCYADRKNNYCFQYSIGEREKTSYLIDAQNQGNITRFINHSGTPNLEPISVYSGHLMHVILLTKCAIKKGTQLTYDYGEDYWKKRASPYN